MQLQQARIAVQAPQGFAYGVAVEAHGTEHEAAARGDDERDSGGVVDQSSDGCTGHAHDERGYRARDDNPEHAGGLVVRRTIREP